jgi:ATP-dependent DNA helicase RecQ
MTTQEKALSILQNTFGYTSFRGQQSEIVEYLAQGKNGLVIMPTGGGKSLCYQIPALLLKGVGVVVSPLIALMQDQVDALKQCGIQAAFLNSTLSFNEKRVVEEKLLQGNIDLLYVAPERVTNEFFLNLITRVDVSLIAIDEAHCVAQWGHDFRPEYLNIVTLLNRFPEVPKVALTATADGTTQKEILERLEMPLAKSFISGFDRPNIQYRIHIKNKPKQQLLHFLKTEYPNDSGIVYCLSRNSVEKTADWLREEGWNALPYHAGMPQNQRQKNQERFLREEHVIIVATIAFGMGIDKPDVRFVAHMDLPKSIEAYYQETGRAGRDGEPSTAWMVYSFADVVKMRQMLKNSPNEHFVRISNQKLNALLGLCETVDCRRKVLLNYFGDTLEENCGNCDSCLSPVKTWEGTIESQKALSCMFRTGQRFGAGHLIDVLRGKETERIEQLGHHKLPTFGCGKDKTVEQWHSVFRQLIAMDYITVDMEGYGGLQVQERAMPILKNELSVYFRHDPLPSKKEIVRKKSYGNKKEPFQKKTPFLGNGESQSLFESLRSFRMEKAKKRNVPPYTIFHDVTLREIVEKMPQTEEELLAISGIGEKKLEKYGEELLLLVQVS